MDVFYPRRKKAQHRLGKVIGDLPILGPPPGIRIMNLRRPSNVPTSVSHGSPNYIDDSCVRVGIAYNQYDPLITQRQTSTLPLFFLDALKPGLLQTCKLHA